TVRRELAQGRSGAAEVLTRLKASLCRDMPPSMFVTMVLAVLAPGQVGRVALASAGHPEPILVRRGAAPKAMTVGGMIMGVFDEAVFEGAGVGGGRAERLVLPTDGVIEAPSADGKRASVDRVLQILDRSRGERAQAQAEALTGGLLAEASGRMADDMTTFVLKRP